MQREITPGLTIPPAPPAPAEQRPNLLLRAWGFAGRRVAGTAGAARSRFGESGTIRLRRLAATRPGRLLAPLAAARRLRPRDLLLAQAEALLVARARGFAAAAPLFARIEAARPALAGPPATLLLRAPGASPALRLAVPARDRPVFLPAAEAGATVAYTAILGTPRTLPPVFGVPGRMRFLCFTDQAVAAPGWEILPPFAGAGAEPAAAAAFHKIRPADALAAAAPEATASLWLDPDRWLVGNPDTLLARWLAPQDVALWRHAATDWRDMAEAHLVAGTVPSAALLAQADRFAAERVPEGRGGLDTGMVWRRHASPAATALTEAWWRSWQEAPGADDLALYRALHAGPAMPPAPPAVLPARLGSAGDNAFVARIDRRPLRRRAARPAGAKLPVVFLSAAAHAKSASILLRGRQLSAMVAGAFPERFEVGFTEDAAAIRDSVVVLTKGAMTSLAPEAIAALGRRNVATIGCWDDVRPDPAKARIVDAHMTLSHRQTLDLNRLYPETPSFLVTHHVNSQVPRLAPPSDRLRTGYFGDIDNTVRPDSLGGMVELVGMDTRDVNDNWLAALPHFNCHWIVRRTRPWDGWKPFLKGFVAARCGATVIVTADDGDATYYLGDDYPFYARSLAAADLEMAMAVAAAGFGGPDWARAQEIMAQVAARSGDAQVCAEFGLMIDQVVA